MDPSSREPVYGHTPCHIYITASWAFNSQLEGLKTLQICSSANSLSMVGKIPYIGQKLLPSQGLNQYCILQNECKASCCKTGHCRLRIELYLQNLILPHISLNFVYNYKFCSFSAGTTTSFIKSFGLLGNFLSTLANLGLWISN